MFSDCVVSEVFFFWGLIAADEEFDELCFKFGIELDDVVSILNFHLILSQMFMLFLFWHFRSIMLLLIVSLYMCRLQKKL